MPLVVSGKTAGYATLQVARDGVVVSNSEVFEFCDKETSASHPDWFALDGKLECLEC